MVTKSTFIYIILIFLVNLSYGAKVKWAEKVLGYNHKFQNEKNNIVHALGPPVVIPKSSLKGTIDPYHKGYVLKPASVKKQNTIVVGFNKKVKASQFVVGGVFNRGIFNKIHIIKHNDNEVLIYKKDGSVKEGIFQKFHVTFSNQYVKGVKLTLDHSVIENWNLIKGIGVTDSKEKIDLKPDVIKNYNITKDKIAVGNEINSKDCFEFSPKVSPDGKKMYFVKMCGPQDDQDIYCSIKENGKWKEPFNVGKPLNNEEHNYVASIQPDGTSLVLGNVYNKDGTMEEGVSISHKKADGTWSFPEEIKIPGYKNQNDHSNYYLSANGKHLLMALEDENSVGNLDLYVSHNFDFRKGWTEPRNLGSKINTPFKEDYPYLSPDGKTLYFSSNGYKGYGGLDIMVVKRKNDSWTDWSEPKNLGPYINSKADDKGFNITTKGDHAYFNSYDLNDNMHNMDIYKVSLPEHLHQTKRILVNGYLKDKKNDISLYGTINYKSLNDKSIKGTIETRLKDGYYAVSLPAGTHYKLSANANRHFKKDHLIKLTKKDISLEYNKDLELEPYYEMGKSFTMDNMQFGIDSAQLTQKMKKELDKLYGKLKQQSGVIVNIEGHTDSIGSKQYNIKLSQERINKVAKYLKEKGLSSWRINTKAYGESQPIASNKTEKGRRKNRRVIITINKKR